MVMGILPILAGKKLAEQVSDAGLTEEEKEHKAELGAAQKLAQTKSKDTDANDPHAFHTISYPSDIGAMENGHWMLFYVNRQNHSKYDSSSGRGTIYSRVNAKTASTAADKTTWAENNFSDNLANQGRIQQGGKGTVDMSDAVTLMPSYNSKATWGVMNPTTTRITDSVAIYLPSNIKSDMSA